MILSFNSRPLVLSALKLGLDPIVVDYWGDQDLKNKARKLVVVKDIKEANIDLDKSELLVKAAVDAYKKYPNIDGILIGSGLDDRNDLWERLNSLAPVFGNSGSIIKKVRDVLYLFEEAKKNKISFPYTQLVSNLPEALEIVKVIGFPIVLKPFYGAGGVNIRIAYNRDELGLQYLEITKKTKEKRLYIQEFIKGQDVSSMILSTGKDCRVLSLNEQLIGLKEVNAPSPFIYCGNIIPLNASKKSTQKLIEISIKLAKIFSLKGINGIDFVLKDENPYLMEINPRFPGTFELIENILETNLLDLHFKAVQEKLPIEDFTYHKYGVKYVLFSKNNLKIPDLSDLKEIHDIPFPGTEINKGSPICSVQIYGNSKKEVIKKGLKKIKEIKMKYAK